MFLNSCRERVVWKYLYYHDVDDDDVVDDDVDDENDGFNWALMPLSLRAITFSKILINVNYGFSLITAYKNNIL